LYKIVVKVLSLRLKKVLDKVIDARKFAFSEGRGLMDKVLVANEVLEEVKRKNSSCVFFKVDCKKTYDSINRLIYYILQWLGFCEKLIGWIKACLKSSSISVLVNGIV